jgi:hypothetical protein
MTSDIGRVGILLGTIYVVGIVLILAPAWSVLTADWAPYEPLVLTAGGLLVLATVGLAYARADRTSRSAIMAGIGGLLTILSLLIWQEGWNAQIIAIGGVLLGVPIAELISRLAGRVA